MIRKVLIISILSGMLGACATAPLSDEEMRARNDKSRVDDERARQAADERELERMIQRQMMDSWDGLREPR